NRTPASSPSNMRARTPRGPGSLSSLGRRRFLQAKLGYGDLAHAIFLDFTGHRHRKFGRQAPKSRDFERRDLPFPPRLERADVDAGAGLGADPGHAFFSIALARHADPLRLGDVGVRVQELLDLAWINVLPAADHHVFDAPDDLYVAGLVHGREVSGVHPAPRV